MFSAFRSATDGAFIGSTRNSEARYGNKRLTSWGSNRIHLTETCEDEVSHVIIQAATTPAQVTVGNITPAIHAALPTQTCSWASIRLTRLTVSGRSKPASAGRLKTS